MSFKKTTLVLPARVAVGILSSANGAFAQATRHSEVWNFGYNCRMDWDAQGAFSALEDPSIFTSEGSATLSHPTTGELILYTDGATVWDAAGTEIATGSLTNRTHLIDNADVQKYGGAFSPDDTKIYYSSLNGTTNLESRLFQYDFTTGIESVIDTQSTRYFHSGAKLAQDGKIYIASGNAPSSTGLSVIDNPNSPANALTFAFGSVAMAPACDVRLGLPQTISSMATVTLAIEVTGPTGMLSGTTTTTPSGNSNLPDGALLNITVEDIPIHVLQA